MYLNHIARVKARRKFPTDIQAEEKPSSATITTASIHENSRTVCLSDVIDITNFSNVTQMIRVTCWIYSFTHNLKLALQTKHYHDSRTFLTRGLGPL